MSPNNHKTAPKVPNGHYQKIPKQMQELHSIFKYLNMVDSTNPERPLTFKVSNTVLIENGNISQWYFQNSSSKLIDFLKNITFLLFIYPFLDILKAKKPKSITFENIIKAFKEPGSQKRSSIVAVYYYFDWREPTHIVSEYLDYKQFKEVILHTFDYPIKVFIHDQF